MTRRDSHYLAEVKALQANHKRSLRAAASNQLPWGPNTYLGEVRMLTDRYNKGLRDLQNAHYSPIQDDTERSV